MKLIIISGRSGSGKSISLHLLEDLGFYCIDNLPASLLPTLMSHMSEQYTKIAIGIDARNLPADLDQFNQIIEDFIQAGIECDIVYLDADENTLLKRYSETRRKHPLTNKHISLREAVRREQELLLPIAHLAGLRVDTSNLSLHDLRSLISDRVNKQPQQLSLLIQSFGFKFGIPLDCDYIFDVRCLPNPYWQPELRPYCGLDKEIATYLGESELSQNMLEDLKQFLQTWIPKFEQGNRNYMTIGIGCTGGRHRSVYIAKQLADFFQKQLNNIQIRHRDLT